MKIGVRPEHDFDRKSIAFYYENYDIVPTPDFSEATRTLKPIHGLSYLGNANNKKCRFCHKGEPEVSFRDDAHALPESIGNKALASYYECDACNCLFGKGIETEYGKFFNFYHNVANVKGKNGPPTLAYKISCAKRTEECMDYCIKLNFDNDIPVIRVCQEVDENHVEKKDDCIILKSKIPQHSPIAVYKALVKMAITVLPFTDLVYYTKATEWIKDLNHKNIFTNGKKLLVKYEFIPGYNVTQYPHFSIFKRKGTVFNLPHTLFHLTYGCLSMLIEVPRDNDFLKNSIEKIIMPPTPFYSSAPEIWDLSDCVSLKEQKHSIVFNFSECKEITENLERIS